MSYSYTKQVYKNVPFKWVVRRKGYYNAEGFSIVPPSLGITVASYTSYSGLTLSAEQISGSLMTIKIKGGELPVRYSYCSDVLGCLATAGQNYNVSVSTYNNFTKVGTVSVNSDTGIASSFSTSNYLSLPSDSFNPSTSNWKINFKVHTGNNVSSSQFICAFGTPKSDGTIRGVRVAVNSGKTNVGLSYDGQSLSANLVGSTSLSTDTDYKISIEFNGTQYIIWINDVIDNQLSSTSSICSCNTFYIGVFKGSNFAEPWLGTIDLSGCNTTINGVETWSPLGTTLATAIGLLPSGVTDDGLAQTWNLFYNDGVFLLDTTNKKNGYSWCGTISVPAHNV